MWTDTTKSFLTIHIHKENRAHAPSGLKEMHCSPHIDLPLGRLAPCCSGPTSTSLPQWSDGSLGSGNMYNASLAYFWLLYRFQGYWQGPSQTFS